jgi:hypothetical protein
MFREIFSTIASMVQHLGNNFSKLIRCKCCNNITYSNTCYEIHKIYRKLSSRKFDIQSDIFPINENLIYD